MRAQQFFRPLPEPGQAERSCQRIIIDQVTYLFLLPYTISAQLLHSYHDQSGSKERSQK